MGALLALLAWVNLRATIMLVNTQSSTQSHEHCGKFKSVVSSCPLLVIIDLGKFARNDNASKYTVLFKAMITAVNSRVSQWSWCTSSFTGVGKFTRNANASKYSVMHTKAWSLR